MYKKKELKKNTVFIQTWDQIRSKLQAADSVLTKEGNALVEKLNAKEHELNLGALLISFF